MAGSVDGCWDIQLPILSDLYTIHAPELRSMSRRKSIRYPTVSHTTQSNSVAVADIIGIECLYCGEMESGG